MMCNLRKWVWGRGNGDVKNTVMPCFLPRVLIHLFQPTRKTGLELGWKRVKIKATDGEVGEREMDWRRLDRQCEKLGKYRSPGWVSLMWGGFTPSHIISPSSNSFDIIIPCSWKRLRRFFFFCVYCPMMSSTSLQGTKMPLHPEPQPPTPGPGHSQPLLMHSWT